MGRIALEVFVRGKQPLFLFTPFFLFFFFLGFFFLLSFFGLLLFLFLLVVVVMVLLLLCVLLGCGFGHELLESHEVTFFFGVALGEERSDPPDFYRVDTTVSFV